MYLLLHTKVEESLFAPSGRKDVYILPLKMNHKIPSYSVWEKQKIA